MKQAATRVEDEQYEIFRSTARQLGTTPSDVLRMFIYAFNENRGFPYQVRVSDNIPLTLEAVSDEVEATRFATALSMGTMHGTR